MKLLSMGMTGVHINTTLDADTAKILASEFGWDIEDVAESEEESIAAARGEEGVAKADAKVAADPNQETRPPSSPSWATSTTARRASSTASARPTSRRARPAASRSTSAPTRRRPRTAPSSSSTRPGHEAFTQMRARGASGADIVVLVVAADDGVMPQTKEAVQPRQGRQRPHHRGGQQDATSRAPTPSACKRELAELGLQPEEWGGDTMFVNVSARHRRGRRPARSRTSRCRARCSTSRPTPSTAASGTVLEALLDRGRGPVARVLVKDGTLHVGDFVLAGVRLRQGPRDDQRARQAAPDAGPSTPVEILGLVGRPQRGRPDARRQGPEEGPGDRREPPRQDGQDPHPGDRQGVARGALQAHRRRAGSRSCASSSRATCRARSRPSPTRSRSCRPSGSGSPSSTRRSAPSPRATSTSPSRPRPSSSASTCAPRARRARSPRRTRSRSASTPSSTTQSTTSAGRDGRAPAADARRALQRQGRGPTGLQGQERRGRRLLRPRAA